MKKCVSREALFPHLNSTSLSTYSVYLGCQPRGTFSPFASHREVSLHVKFMLLAAGRSTHGDGSPGLNQMSIAVYIDFFGSAVQ